MQKKANQLNRHFYSAVVVVTTKYKHSFVCFKKMEIKRNEFGFLSDFYVSCGNFDQPQNELLKANVDIMKIKMNQLLRYFMLIDDF